jgi:DnaJ-like protein
MPGELINEALASAPSGAVLLVLFAVPGALAVLYVHYMLALRRLRPDLSLRKLEAIELHRAVLLYEKVARRIEEAGREGRLDGLRWRLRDQAQESLRQRFREELEDLQTYARDLRATILRLRGRPLMRYKFWIRGGAFRSSLGCSLACYSLLVTGLFAFLSCHEASQVVPEVTASLGTFAAWQPVETRLLLANWIGVDLVFFAMPLFYFVKRASLHKEHRAELRRLKEFAAMDPDRLIHQQQDNCETADEWHETSCGADQEQSWFAILGVSPSATLDDVRQAYKTLVKKNHPDRVHGMSQSFIELAEAETKKLNMAYEEAIKYCDRDATPDVREKPSYAI